MYRKIETDVTGTWQNGETFRPLATFQDQESKLQVVEDDKCFVVARKCEDNTYAMTPWIPVEIVNALAKLPRNVATHDGYVTASACCSCDKE